MIKHSLQQLEWDFSNYLHEWHQQYDFAGFNKLAQLEKITVDDSRDVESQYLRPKRKILLNCTEGERKRKLTEMHEMTHHVFKTGQGGHFLQQLEALLPNNLAEQNEQEEMIVERTSLQLLIPRPMFEHTCVYYPYDAQRVQKIAIEARCSFVAVAWRLALAFDRPISGLVMSVDGYISNFFNNEQAKYRRSGRGFQLDKRHPLLGQPLIHDQICVVRAQIPFKESAAKIQRYMHAVYDQRYGQVIVFFNAPKQFEGL